MSTPDVSLVAILGMHRSGTSCLAGSLESRGLHLDEVFQWSPHNLKGNREHAEVMALNEAVLEHSGGSWDHPPAVTTWTPDQARRRDDLIARCTRGFTTSWGFKDPRCVFTLPFWQDAGRPMRYVGTFRHPLLAAMSLHARNGMPLADGVAMWAAYNRRLLAHWHALHFPVVSFDEPAAEYLRGIDQVSASLHLAPTSPAGASQFLEDQLRHQEPDPGATLSADVAVLYAELQAIYGRWRATWA